MINLSNYTVIPMGKLRKNNLTVYPNWSHIYNTNLDKI